MPKLPILKNHATEFDSDTNTFNVFPVKALNQQTAALFTLKALSCLLIALMTIYLYYIMYYLSILYYVEILHLAKLLSAKLYINCS
jgi:hypothetical protein